RMKKLEPESGLQLTLGFGSTRSVAVAVYVTIAPPGPVASTAKSAGTVRAGAVVSWTITWKLALDVLPCASVEEQFTDVWPSGKVDPDGGLQLTGSVPSTRSVAVAV